MKKVVSLDYDKEKIKTIGDSMCYDSGFKALSAQVFEGSDKYDLFVVAQGNVKVWWKDNVYKHASQMPDELLDKFRDGTAYKEIRCEENNWWEVIVYKNDEYMTGICMDFEPCDFEGEDDIEQFVLDVIYPE